VSISREKLVGISHARDPGIKPYVVPEIIVTRRGGEASPDPLGTELRKYPTPSGNDEKIGHAHECENPYNRRKRDLRGNLVNRIQW